MLNKLGKVKFFIKNNITTDLLISFLNIKVRHETADEIRACCPVHGGDNPTAFRLKKGSNSWICFSHGCHELFGGDVFGLVMGILNIDFPTSVKILSDLCGLSNDNTISDKEILRFKLDTEISYIKDRIHKTYMPPEEVNEKNLKDYIMLRTDYFNRVENGGFSDDTLDFFEIGGHYYDAFNVQRELIPIRDEFGRLIAFCGRRVDGKSRFKYLFTNGFPKQTCLYNLFNVKKHVNEFNNTIIVVEGFKSVWFLHELGFFNSVACMGSSLTKTQVNLLCKYCFRVMLMLDLDEAGNLGTERSVSLLIDKLEYKNIVLDKQYLKYSDGSSPSDFQPEYISNLLKGEML